MASVSYNIQKAIQTILQGLTISGINKNSILIRKQTKIGEVVDCLPSIIISPYGKNDDSPADMEGGRFRVYPIAIIMADATEDFQTDQELNQGWQEQVQDAVLRDNTGQMRSTFPGTPVWMLEQVESPTFDLAKLNSLYSYQGIVIKFHSKE